MDLSISPGSSLDSKHSSKTSSLSKIRQTTGRTLSRKLLNFLTLCPPSTPRTSSTRTRATTRTARGQFPIWIERSEVDGLKLSVDGLYAVWNVLADECREVFENSRPSIRAGEPTIYY